MINVKVCMGTHCSMMGSLNLYEDIEELTNDFPEQVNLEGVQCMKICKTDQSPTSKTPVVKVNDLIITSAKAEEVIAYIRELMTT